MKKLISKFIIGVMVFVLLPISVDAVGFTKSNSKVDNPVPGGTPDTTVVEELSDGDIVKTNEFNIKWYEFNSVTDTFEDMTTSTFKDKTVYMYRDADPNKRSEWVDSLAMSGYFIPTDIEVYTNDIKCDNSMSCETFAVGGIEELKITITEPIAGETPSTKAILSGVPEDVIVKSDVEIEWYEIDDAENINAMSSLTFELGKKYLFAVLTDINQVFNSEYIIDNYGPLFDFRTRTIVNEIDMTNEKQPVYGPLEEEVRITEIFTNIVDSMSVNKTLKNVEYSTVLFADLDYKLPETISVKVSDVELTTDKYTYDSKTGELIIPASSVTGDIIIEAKAVYDKVEEPITPSEPLPNVPQTSDNVGIYILSTALSMLGLILTLLYIKKVR